MAYRSPLESRLAKQVTKAITEYGLIENGDRVMVGLSGGKDSWALLQILDVLRRRAPIDFSLVAVNVDSGYKDYKHDVLATTCRERGWELRIEHTSIGEVMDDILDAGDTPCSLCARLRRGVLYRIADEVGATKIALGHHLDDVVETLLLNTFFAGALKAMPARLVSDDGRHTVIRPLVYVQEAEASAYAKESALPVIGCCCPACGDLSLQRQRIKRLITGPRARAPAREGLDDEGAHQRDAAAPARPPAGRGTGVAAGRVGRVDRAGVPAAGRPSDSGDMRAVVQRVRYARVEVDDRVVGSIGQGLLALVGVQRGDGPADVAHVAAKLRELRIFDDDGGADGRPRMNRSVVDVGGSVLVVSQFTLAADTRRGRRPSFDAAAPPDEARRLYEDVVADLRASGVTVATGEFQAAMRVTLENDGPVTFVLESRPS